MMRDFHWATRSSAMSDATPPQHLVELPRNRPRAEIPFLIFCSFLCTFAFSRLVVAGLHGGWWKLGGFLFVSGTHIHHYNYGIVILSLAGFFSLTVPGRRHRWTAAILYGVGLGLIFDEFAMWLRLEDDYYHRLSYDAVVAVASLFLLLATFGAFHDRWHKRRQAHAYAIPAGTVLFREGDLGHDAYFVIEGRVRVLKDTPHGPLTLATIGPGEFVGEIALFADCPRSATAEAVDALRVRCLSRKNLLYSIELHPELGTRLLRTLAQRLFTTTQQLANGSLGTSGTPKA
jgi:hypothetical protein